ncbi:MAG: glycosyltransferase family 2 protein, partial [Bacteroidetes bacterium]|nr:glycosyltransferase family 2 protein [Bacteroidota bacterium]MBU1797795.1 glycosyltransferase family 2 protein [Bacteroidota bacterium]
MSNSIKIASVVVTFNRLELLKECISSLREQTRKIDEIFIINNSSSDGTEEWLSKQKDLTTITQQNSGGAGGFYTGIKTAYEKGYDWIWVMDDDGLPKNNALEELTKYIDGKVGVLNSIVLSKSNEKELAFGIEDSEEKKHYILFDQIIDKTTINGVNFFNGSLFSRATISKIGFPNPKFYIWGDETEYFLRLKAAGISFKSVVASLYIHPNQNHRYLGKGLFFYRIIQFNSLGVKYFPRNLMAICYLYKEFTFRRLVKTFFYDILGLLFIQKNILFAFLYIKSIFDGILFIKQLN